jgi:hypothetical protein
MLFLLFVPFFACLCQNSLESLQILEGTVVLTLGYALPVRGVRVRLEGHERAYGMIAFRSAIPPSCCSCLTWRNFSVDAFRRRWLRWYLW